MRFAVLTINPWKLTEADAAVSRLRGRMIINMTPRSLSRARQDLSFNSDKVQQLFRPLTGWTGLENVRASKGVLGVVVHLLAALRRDRRARV